jgi:1-acyl-sn-glycerol-3-phosphate acyltransferase
VLIAAVRSAITYVAVSLYVLVTGLVGMLLATVFGWTGLLYIFGHGGVYLGLWLCGIRFKVAGADNLPRDRAAVYCSNHESNVDPPILFTALHPRMHILYKHEIDQIPVLARAFRMGGFIPIDRRNKESAMRSIEKGAASIRDGSSFLIFPEGTRSRTGQMLPFKKGGFVMAIKAGLRLCPSRSPGAQRCSGQQHHQARPDGILRVSPSEAASAHDRESVDRTVRARIQERLARDLLDESGHLSFGHLVIEL